MVWYSALYSSTQSGLAILHENAIVVRHELVDAQRIVGTAAGVHRDVPIIILIERALDDTATARAQQAEDSTPASELPRTGHHSPQSQRTVSERFSTQSRV